MVDKTLLSKTQYASKIHLHNPAGQHKYIFKIRHITRKHNLLPKLIALENQQNYTPTPEAIKEYEEIDKLLVKER